MPPCLNQSRFRWFATNAPVRHGGSFGDGVQRGAQAGRAASGAPFTLNIVRLIRMYELYKGDTHEYDH